MDRDLVGKIVIVTGGTRGIGAEIARRYLEAGAHVLVCGRTVRDELPTCGQRTAEFVQADVRQPDQAAAVVDFAVDRFGRLDILVNNAGVLRDRMVFRMSAEEWDLVLRVHLRGHFVTTRFATAYWRERSKSTGGPVYARIVNTSSEAFLLGSAGQPNYAAAKAGIVALTVATARSCARYGVRANVICPRARTAMTAGLMGAPPAGAPDPLAPERVAPLLTYLAGPAGERITGEVFVVHGDVVAVLAPPAVRASFRAGGRGAWSAEGLDEALGPLFRADPPRPGFAATDTLSLAESTFGE
jgi:NAD(P)-dependent dehydrogenase (short-subunit alcohol dehydrogenase family)